MAAAYSGLIRAAKATVLPQARSRLRLAQAGQALGHGVEQRLATAEI